MSKLCYSLGAGLVIVVSGACSNLDSGRNDAPHVSRGYGIQGSDEGITAIAEREVIRRQERLRRADAAALRANEHSAQGDHEAALRSYRKALDTLPPRE